MPRHVRPRCASGAFPFVPVHRFGALRVLLVLALLAAGAAPAWAGAFSITPVSQTAPVAWASSVVSITRGPNDIGDPLSGTAFFGDPLNALGPATIDFNDVVSLGDGGEITLAFSAPFFDGPGADLAVYENGFGTSPTSIFAELAFVEVSSDGASFARFPNESLTVGPIGAFDPIDPTDTRNLAGITSQPDGVPFDLLDLATHPLVLSGGLDLAAVQFVRVIDVIGNGTTLDSFGRDVFDPHPTAFASGSSGFDLEAVGVLHTTPEPSALALLGLGLAAACATRRTRATRRPEVRPSPGRSA